MSERDLLVQETRFARKVAEALPKWKKIVLRRASQAEERRGYISQVNSPIGEEKHSK